MAVYILGEKMSLGNSGKVLIAYILKMEDGQGFPNGYILCECENHISTWWVLLTDLSLNWL